MIIPGWTTVGGTFLETPYLRHFSVFRWFVGSVVCQQAPKSGFAAPQLSRVVSDGVGSDGVWAVKLFGIGPVDCVSQATLHRILGVAFV